MRSPFICVPAGSIGVLDQELARWSVALAALLIVVPLILAHIRYGTGNAITASFVFHLALTSVLSLLLFGAAGIVIALAVRSYVQTMSRLYAFDLAGAALGAIVVVPLMWRVSVPALIVAIGPVAASSALLFAGGTRRPMGRLAAGLFGLGLVAVALAATSSIYNPKPAEASLGNARSDRWTPLSRVVAYGAAKGALFEPLFYDRGGAPVAAYRRGGTMPDWRVLHLGPQSLGYVFGGRQRAVVIGGGGGRDILNALTSGVHHLDVIELNRASLTRLTVPSGPSREHRTRFPGCTPSSATDGRRSPRAVPATT